MAAAQTQNWLQLSPAPSPVLAPELAPTDNLSLGRTKSNDSTSSGFLSNTGAADPSRQPLGTRVSKFQPTFSNMIAERRLEAAAGIRLSAFNH